MYRWRWEFFRRRDDIRDFFLYAVEAEKNKPEMAFMSVGRPPRGEPGFYVHISGARWEWGYVHQLPDPSVSEHPEELIFSYLDEWPPILLEHVRGDELEYVFPPGTSLPIENVAVVVFNLDKPLEPQIRLATRAMRLTQKAEHGVILQRRQHPLRWLGYLRALDARETGATWAEITDLFYAQGLLDRRKDPSGGYCAPPPQAARDMWEAANDLRFNF